MKGLRRSSLCLSVLLSAGAGSLAAEQVVIDRMVAVVDGEVVTESDIEAYRARGRFMGTAVSDDDRVILDQIIENILIARQIDQFPGNEVSDAQIDAYLSGFGSPDDFPGDLVPQEMRRRAVARERYYQSVIRSLGEPTAAEVRARYENEFVPALRQRGVEVIPPLPEVQTQLREVVIADKLVAEISARVELLYRRYQVEVVE